MAANEYYDAIGEVLAYILSAEDKIIGQRRVEEGTYFIIQRGATNLEFYAVPNKRYFTIRNRKSLTQTITSAYEDDNQLLRGHMEAYDIDDSEVTNRDLYTYVAKHRITDINEEEAKRLINDITSFSFHSGCRIHRLTTSPPNDEQKDDLWNGVEAVGLLYPYEENFRPRDYELIAQEVISVGDQIRESMEKLDVFEEMGLTNPF